MENILLTPCSLFRTTKAGGYATGNFSFSDLTLPCDGLKKEQRSFTEKEIGRFISAAPEPFATIWALTAVLCLTVGE
jgi:hypothetical protein